MGSIMDQERPWDRKEEVKQETAPENSPITEAIFAKSERHLQPRFEALRKRLGLISKQP